MIPISVTVFEPVAGGGPVYTGTHQDLTERITDYADSRCINFGPESLDITFDLLSMEEGVFWAHRFMAPVLAVRPDGVTRFTGYLHKVDLVLGDLKISRSLEEVANAIVIEYNEPGQVKTSLTVPDATSIRLYGRRERRVQYSDVSTAEATGYATSMLKQYAYPANTTSSTYSNEHEPSDELSVTLHFVGWPEALKCQVMTLTTAGTTPLVTHISGRLTAYNSTNNYFSTSTAQMTSAGRAVTITNDTNVTYFDEISKKIAIGDTSSNRLVWMINDPAEGMIIRTWAAATPDSIAYEESQRTGVVRDATTKAVLPEWAWDCDAMVVLTDLATPTPAPAQITTLTRKYVERVTLHCTAEGLVEGALEAGDTKDPIDLISHPLGKDQGADAHTSVITDRIRRETPIGVTPPSRGGTGVSNDDSSTITVDPPGPIRIRPPTGGGGTELPTGTGTPPNLAVWTGASALGDSGILIDPLMDGGTFAMWDWGGTSRLDTYGQMVLVAPGVGGVLAMTAGAALTIDSVLEINTNGAVANQVLAYISGVWVPRTLGTLYGSGTAGRITQWAAGGAAIEDSSLIKTGSLLTLNATASGTLATDTGTLALGGYTLDLDGDLRVTGAGASANWLLAWDGTRFAPKDPTLITGLVNGTGTAGRVAQWQDTDTLEAAPLIMGTAGGVLTLNPPAGNVTVAITTGITLAGGGNTLTLTGSLTSDAATLAFGGRTLTLATNSGTVSFGAASQTLTITGSIDLTGAGAATNSVLAYNGARFAPATLISLTLPTGTGTNGRLTQWTGTNTIGDSTLIKSGAGLLTLSSATNFTVTFSSAITLDGGSNTLTLTGSLTSDAATLAFGGRTLTLNTNSGTLAYSAASKTLTVADSITLAGGNNTLTLTGSLTSDNGTLDLNGFTHSLGGNFTTVGAVTIDNGTFDIDGYTIQIRGNFSTSGVVSFPTGGNGIVIAGSGGTAGRIPEFASAYALQDGTLAKSGSGVITFNAGSNYTAYFHNSGDVVTGTGEDPDGGGVLGTQYAVMYWLDANRAEGDGNLAWNPGAQTLILPNLYDSGDAIFGGQTRMGGTSAASHTLQLSDDDAAKTTTNTWTVTSDERTKHITGRYTAGLAFLQALPPVMEYTYNGRYDTPEGAAGVGFIAQQLVAHAPGWIRRRRIVEEQDDLLLTNTSDLTYALLNGVLELADRVAVLERRGNRP